MNESIDAPEIRLIDEYGEMLGVMSPRQALEIARERGVDLVELSLSLQPPICTLMDYDRYKDEQAKEWGKKP